MTAAALLHRYFPGIYLFFIALLGIALGWLAALVLGIWLTPPAQLDVQAVAGRSEVAGKRPLTDYQVILDRNIFNSTAPVTSVLVEEDTAPARTTTARGAAITEGSAGATPSAQNRKDYILIGTVVGGDASLAVLQGDRNTDVYALGAELPDGGVVDRIFRHSVTIRYAEGDTTTLVVEMNGAPPPAAAQKNTKEENPYKIEEVGDNRWVIPRESADGARGNLNELLRQARVEPRIVDGQTQGFVVRMIQPNTLLDMLGIRRGDVLMKINGIDLNSPEKALQIFQQLREARSISVDLLRGGEPTTFNYEIN
ncbi:MAG: type II secretion system protein GspC [Geoalkalibacter sp.]|jgi:general secretion pathway protein C|uniref:type II secretion system protein GspC n=1 Tax=Geoalkalibacter sp. TaxID=3041440 RepID=UPI002AA090A1|nr:type II secretion system protein GspC [Thermodesulfobacteriota bacterium]